MVNQDGTGPRRSSRNRTVPSLPAVTVDGTTHQRALSAEPTVTTDLSDARGPTTTKESALSNVKTDAPENATATPSLPLKADTSSKEVHAPMSAKEDPSLAPASVEPLPVRDEDLDFVNINHSDVTGGANILGAPFELKSPPPMKRPISAGNSPPHPLNGSPKKSRVGSPPSHCPTEASEKERTATQADHLPQLQTPSAGTDEDAVGNKDSKGSKANDKEEATNKEDDDDLYFKHVDDLTFLADVTGIPGLDTPSADNGTPTSAVMSPNTDGSVPNTPSTTATSPLTTGSNASPAVKGAAMVVSPVSLATATPPSTPDRARGREKRLAQIMLGLKEKEMEEKEANKRRTSAVPSTGLPRGIPPTSLAGDRPLFDTSLVTDGCLTAALMDPLLVSTYTAVLNLRRAAVVPVNETDAPCTNSFCSYSYVYPALSVDGKTAIRRGITFVECGVYINPSRASPLRVRILSQPTDPVRHTYHERRDFIALPAVFTTMVITTSCSVVKPEQIALPSGEQGMVRKFQGMPFRQEAERMFSFFGTTHGFSEAACAVSDDMVTFSTRAVPMRQADRQPQNKPISSPKKSRWTGAPSKPSIWSAYPSVPGFATNIPIFDGRRKGVQSPFLFDARSFEALSLRTLPLYEEGLQDLPPETLVCVGYTAQTSNMSGHFLQMAVELGFNLQFLILVDKL